MIEELNTKLAEWVWPDEHERFIHSCKGEDNFTDDDIGIALCFKWLAPELYEQNYHYELSQWDRGLHKAIISKWATTASDAVAMTPAIAFCKAIEKLIDLGVI